MSRRPTMRDVAAAAGVSVKTVSRVVNDEAAVRDIVADRVRAAIATLGYRPDHRAQLLRLFQLGRLCFCDRRLDRVCARRIWSGRTAQRDQHDRGDDQRCREH